MAAGAGLTIRRSGPSPARGRGGSAKLLELGTRFDESPAGIWASAGKRRTAGGGSCTPTATRPGRRSCGLWSGAVERAPEIEVVEEAFAVDLVLEGGKVAGLVAVTGTGGGYAPGAGGGAGDGGSGQLYRHTTNPVEATADGLAMAFRAGARVADVEFVQFHPTALATGDDPMPLLTEALRGEGAVLLDEARGAVHGGRAPRWPSWRRGTSWRGRSSGGWRRAVRCSWMRGRRWGSGSRSGSRRSSRVPGAGARSSRRADPGGSGGALPHGRDPGGCERPVFSGGVVGVRRGGGDRGSRANRLASNSLLEALVFGARVAEDLWSVPGVRGPRRLDGVALPAWESPAAGRKSIRVEEKGGDGVAVATIAAVRRLAWERMGVVRDGGGLTSALVELDRLERSAGLGGDGGEMAGRDGSGRVSAARARAWGEARNLLCAARLVVTAALARRESRGGHFRVDFPAPLPVWQRRIVLSAGRGGTIRTELRAASRPVAAGVAGVVGARA